MLITRKNFLRQLAAGTAMLSFGAALVACSEEKDASKKSTQATTDTAAKIDTKPAVSNETTGSTTVTPPTPEGDADMAKVLVPGPLPEMFIGKADAKVTIVEYMSMTCPHCARFSNDVFPKIKEKYVDTGKVKFILREFPLDTPAAAAIMLARCAPQGEYFPMVEALFKSQGTWAVSNDIRAALLQMAKLAGFTQESFNACLTNQKLLDDVNATREKASKDFGVDSTPTFFIGGKRYAGEMSVEEMSALIDPLL